MKKMSATQGANTIALQSKLLCMGTMAGVVMTSIVLLLSALVMSRVDLPQSAVPLLSTGALMIGSFVAGYVSAWLIRSNGLVWGLLCGFLIFFVCMFCELFLMQGEVGELALYKMAICAVASMIGGVLGVNKKRK